MKKLTNAKLDITYALKNLPKWGEMRQIYNLLDKVDEYIDLNDKEVLFGEYEEFEILEGYRCQRFMCLTKGRKKIFLHINQDDVGKYLVQYIPERDVKYIVLLRICRTQKNAVKTVTPTPTEKDIKMDQSTVPNTRVTASDLTLVPKTGKIADFFKALKVNDSYISITGTTVPFQMLAVFEVYRLVNMKAVGYVYPPLTRAVPMEVRDGKIYEVIGWPAKNFLEHARVENAFHFERYPLENEKAARPAEKLEADFAARLREKPSSEVPMSEPTAEKAGKLEVPGYWVAEQNEGVLPLREAYCTTAVGELGETYRLSFRDMDEQLLITGEVDHITSTSFKRWYAGVMEIIDRVVLGSQFRKAKVVFVAGEGYDPEFVVIMVDDRRLQLTLSETGGLKAMGHLPANVNVTGPHFVIELVAGKQPAVTEAAPQPKIPTREWIPQVNQFVHVEGDDELYTIVDFDQYAGSFILKLADTARHDRSARLGGQSLDSRNGFGRKDGGYFTVEGGRLRPYTLRY